MPQDSLEFKSLAPDHFMRAMRKATGGWIRSGRFDEGITLHTELKYRYLLLHLLSFLGFQAELQASVLMRTGELDEETDHAPEHSRRQ